MSLAKGQQFLTHTYRGHQVSGFYTEDKGKGRIDLMKDGQIVRSTDVPAYILWNYYAHAQDVIDTALDEVVA